MKLTHSVSYAVGVLLRVAKADEHQHLTAREISDGCRFPPRFLYRILRRLVDAGILQGVSGPGGGYRLAKLPRRITLLNIVTAVEGAPTASQLEAACDDQRRAVTVVNRVCAQSAKRFAEELAGVTLEGLMRKRGGGAKSRGRKRKSK